MKKRRIWLLVFIVILGLLVSACAAAQSAEDSAYYEMPAAEGYYETNYEEIVLEAIEKATPEIKRIIDAQKEFINKAGVPKKEVKKFVVNEEVKARVKELAEKDIKSSLEHVAELIKQGNGNDTVLAGKKGYISVELERIGSALKEKLAEEFPDDTVSINTDKPQFS